MTTPSGYGMQCRMPIPRPWKATLGWFPLFSSDSLRLTVLSVNGTLALTLEGHTSLAYTVVLSPDGLRMASCERDCTVRLWDAVSGAHTATLEGHSSLIYSIAFSPDGLHLVSCSYDQTVRLWNAGSG